MERPWAAALSSPGVLLLLLSPADRGELRVERGEWAGGREQRGGQVVSMRRLSVIQAGVRVSGHAAAPGGLTTR